MRYFSLVDGPTESRTSHGHKALAFQRTRSSKVSARRNHNLNQSDHSKNRTWRLLPNSMTDDSARPRPYDTSCWLRPAEAPPPRIQRWAVPSLWPSPAVNMLLFIWEDSLHCRPKICSSFFFFLCVWMQLIKQLVPQIIKQITEEKNPKQIKFGWDKRLP